MYDNGPASEFNPAFAQAQQYAQQRQAAFLGARQAGPADDPRPAGPVFQAITATEMELTRLQERLDVLERRLSAALSPVPQATGASDGPKPARPPVSETTERVARIGLGIQVAHELVQRLIERLEV